MDMVMQTVTLCDTIFLQLQPGSGQIQMSCRFEPDNGNALSCGEDNIAVRCARAFFRESGCSLQRHDLSIQLVKRIPMMAGLGGGSADGAAVLSGLNLLTGTNLPLEQLEKIAFCGADIPFCLRGGTLRARGIGEQFSPLPPMPDCPILIIKPRFGISTGAAFARCDSQPYRHAEVEKMIQALQTGSVAQIAGALQNVFEELCSGERQLAAARELLRRRRAAGVLLSGSGSALFGLFEEEDTARTALHALQTTRRWKALFCAVRWRRGLTVLRGRYDIRFHPLMRRRVVCSRLSNGCFSTLVPPWWTNSFAMRFGCRKSPLCQSSV